MQTGLGFLMSESWMGESPYGGQGDENAYDELHISMKTSTTGFPSMEDIFAR